MDVEGERVGGSGHFPLASRCGGASILVLVSATLELAIIHKSYSARRSRRPQSVREAGFGRAGLQWLLLTGVRRPGGRGDDFKGGADAAIGFGMAFLINLASAQYHAAGQERTRTLAQAICGPHGAEIVHKSQGMCIRHRHHVAIDDREREASTLQQRAEFAHVNRRRDPRTGTAGQFDFSRQERVAQLKERPAADERGEEESIRSKARMDLRKRAGKVVNCVQGEPGNDEIEAGVGKWQVLEIDELMRRMGVDQEFGAIVGGGERGEGMIALQNAAQPTVMTSKIDDIGKAATNDFEPIRKIFGDTTEQKIRRCIGRLRQQSRGAGAMTHKRSPVKNLRRRHARPIGCAPVITEHLAIDIRRFQVAVTTAATASAFRGRRRENGRTRLGVR